MTMSTRPSTASLPHYRADQPVSEPSHDAYSRSAFADGIAKSILSLPRNECYVIGLHGPWGDGKTSVLRFVDHSLKGDPSTVVAWFNPWRFLNHEAMLGEFFDILAASAKADLKTKGEKVAATIAKYGKWVGMVDDRAARVSDAAAEHADATLEQLRKRLRTELATLGKRIVVFIDDIDRLDSSEVAALFRLIKACADLPNVVYVLAFDREMVARTIGARLVDGDTDAGRSYLEKIIQVPVALPPASRRDLNRSCKAGVHETLKSFNLTMPGDEIIRWEYAYQDSIARRLKTPRHVTQYLNAVRFALPLLANEVNIVDLLLVEALRVCYAPAYEVIRANQSIFIGAPVGEIERRFGRAPQDDLLAGAKQGMAKADADALDHLVETLFPRYHWATKGNTLGLESVKQWTRHRRVCSPAYGPRYFAYAIGSSDVADADIEAILLAAADNNSTELRTLLDKQLESLKQTMLVFKLDERLQSIPDQSASRIATMLATLSDRFEAPFSLHDFSHPGRQAASLAVKLCRQAGSEEERSNAAQSVLQHSKEMWFAAAFMREVDPPYPNPGKGSSLVSAEQLSSVRNTFLLRHRRYGGVGTTELDLEQRWKFETLFCLARAGGRELVHNQLVPNMRTRGNIAILLLQLLAQPIASSSEIIPTPDDFGPEELAALILLVDIDEMAKIVSEQWLPVEKRKGPSDWNKMKPDDRLLAQFWYQYEQSKVQPPANLPQPEAKPPPLKECPGSDRA